jgi:hypothetical protein
MAQAKSVAIPAVQTSFVSNAVTNWAFIFPVASVCLFLIQPSLLTSATFAVGLMALLAIFAHLSVNDANSFESKQLAIGLLSPIQFAIMMWAAVHMGREIAGASLITSSLAAMLVFAGALLVDGLLSGALLLAANTGTLGTSVASLISAKYAGLLGKIDA